MASRNNPHQTPSVTAYQESGAPVRLDYDTWTPRPHFILVQATPKQDATPDELAATYRLISNFLRKYPQYDQNAILSFHRGRWYQMHTGLWHAHLCVPYQPYLQQANMVIQSIPSNREWDGASTVEQGLSRWRNKKLANYQKYKMECVDKKVSTPTRVEQYSLETLAKISNEFKLAWTSPAPRIAVIFQGSGNQVASLSSLYDFLSTVRQTADGALGKLDSSFRNFGCHLCLYVSGLAGTNVTRRSIQIFRPDGTKEMNSKVVGYIQMDEGQYLEWIPSTLRETWRQDFARAEHFVET